MRLQNSVTDATESAESNESAACPSDLLLLTNCRPSTSSAPDSSPIDTRALLEVVLLTEALSETDLARERRVEQSVAFISVQHALRNGTCERSSAPKRRQKEIVEQFKSSQSNVSRRIPVLCPANNAPDVITLSVVITQLISFATTPSTSIRTGSHYR